MAVTLLSTWNFCCTSARPRIEAEAAAKALRALLSIAALLLLVLISYAGLVAFALLFTWNFCYASARPRVEAEAAAEALRALLPIAALLLLVQLEARASRTGARPRPLRGEIYSVLFVPFSLNADWNKVSRAAYLRFESLLLF